MPIHVCHLIDNLDGNISFQSSSIQIAGDASTAHSPDYCGWQCLGLSGNLSFSRLFEDEM